jgi:hypothetical protein
MTLTSGADPGCLSRLPDPNFSNPDPESTVKKISDPGSGSASKNLGIFNPKNCFYALGNMIRDVHPGSRIFIFSPSRISESKRHRIPDPDPQHSLKLIKVWTQDLLKKIF